MEQFGGSENYNNRLDSKFLLQPISWAGGSSWGTGQDEAFDAFIRASSEIEMYDALTGREPMGRGIFTMPDMMKYPYQMNDPEKVYMDIREKVHNLFGFNKDTLTFLGGDHSISIPILDAYMDKFPDLTVVHFDAHADVRSSYDGNKYSHACSMYRATKRTRVMPVGVRSGTRDEMGMLQNPTMAKRGYIVDDEIYKLTNKHPVYISVDMDVLDPGIFPATGTPEPGGLTWFELISFLETVMVDKWVVGFDIVEFSPKKGFTAYDVMVAKLYYKMLGYL